MPRYLDIDTWTRRELYDFFKDYDQPYFNVCVRLDVTNLLELVRARGIKVSLALHYFALRMANEVEPFRYRFKEGKIFVYDVIDGGTTVLLPNESFAYAYFNYVSDFETFVTGMGKAVEDVRNDTGPLKPTLRDDVIYHTSLPWIPFTSFSHARKKGRGESIPRIVFGKFIKENGRVMMPFSVEVHHALMDGIHVGRFLEKLEDGFAEPERFVQG
jgi:chloramphenicol O-acetyltransferase type A